MSFPGTIIQLSSRMMNPKQPVITGVPVMDTSIQAWISNTQSILKFPVTILSVSGLLVAGTFAEVAPRKSLEFLDNMVGKIVFFIVPLLFAESLGWATGLLAAVVSLIIFTRLQKVDPEVEEGFVDSSGTQQNSDTSLIPNGKRWFVERVLGETPVAISSNRVRSYTVDDENPHKSSSRSSNK